MAERLSVDEMTLFVMQCEDTIKQRLSDPQSYSRQSVSELVVTKGSLAEFMGIDTPEKAAIVARGNEISEELRGLRMTLAELYVAGNYERIAVTIIFDHRSAPGEQTREASVCSEYVNEGMAWAGVGGHNVAIDGLTDMDWQQIKTDRMFKELEAATAEARSDNQTQRPQDVEETANVQLERISFNLIQIEGNPRQEPPVNAARCV